MIVKFMIRNDVLSAKQSTIGGLKQRMKGKNDQNTKMWFQKT